jgi:putative spermidine/putrescine transport system substrate-binding protein
LKVRRRAALGLSALLLFAACGFATAETNELVVASWGGKFKAGWDKSLIPNFEKKYGVKIVWSVGQGSAGTLAKLLAQKDNPQIDVALLDEGPHSQAIALGLVEDLDLSRLPNSKDLYPQAFEPNNAGINFAISGTGLIYNTKVFEENKWTPPTSWLDLFRQELKGKIAIHSVRASSGVDLLLALNRIGGGNEENVDAGFAKLQELKPSLLTIVISGNELAPLLQQRAVVASTLSIDDFTTMAASGIPIKFVWPKYIGFGPLNKKAELPPEVAEKVVYGADTLNRLHATNWQAVNRYRAGWIDRFSKEIESR